MGFDLKPEQLDLLVTPYADGKPAPVRIPDSGMRVRFPDGVPVYAGLAGINLAPARVFDKTSFRSGGGGMVGNARDMLTFIEAIRTGGSPILSRDTAAAMMTVQTGDFLDREPRTRLGVRLRRLDPHRSDSRADAAVARHVRLGRRVGPLVVHRSGEDASASYRSATRRSKA